MKASYSLYRIEYHVILAGIEAQVSDLRHILIRFDLYITNQK
jgi:hypothetical protein